MSSNPVALPGDEALAARVGVPVEVVRAIRTIESGNAAPISRFEPRVFNNLTSQRFAGTVSTFTNNRRDAIDRAFALAPEAAVRSSSWGFYQVLGMPLWRRHGVRAREAFDANPIGESNEMFVWWWGERPQARDAVRAQDWAHLARLYNGSDQTPWRGRFEAARTKALALSGASSSGGNGAALVGVALALAVKVLVLS